MSLPTTTRAFRRTKDGKNIELVQDTLPKSLQPTEVLIKIHAVSLNFRDVGMLNGRYPMEVIDQGVPCSDAAATIVAIGDSVNDFKKGDYVSPTFLQEFDENPVALGGDIDGVLREYAIYDQTAITKVPEYLSHEEASTIACAGVTAWTALDLDKKKTVRSALMQGTGGVSIFALLLCLGAGIKPIITSSSDEKLASIRALGANEGDVLGINYRTRPDWDEETKKLTGGHGVDVVVNNIGITSIEQSLNALRRFGTISLVGFLGGMDVSKQPDMFGPIFMKGAKVQGILVGTDKDQRDLCDFLAEKKISLKPTIDKVFRFEDSPEAFKYLYSGAHVGKVVIKL